MLPRAAFAPAAAARSEPHVSDADVRRVRPWKKPSRRAASPARRPCSAELSDEPESRALADTEPRAPPAAAYAGCEPTQRNEASSPPPMKPRCGGAGECGAGERGRERVRSCDVSKLPRRGAEVVPPAGDAAACVGRSIGEDRPPGHAASGQPSSDAERRRTRAGRAAKGGGGGAAPSGGDAAETTAAAAAASPAPSTAAAPAAPALVRRTVAAASAPAFRADMEYRRPTGDEERAATGRRGVSSHPPPRSPKPPKDEALRREHAVLARAVPAAETWPRDSAAGEAGGYTGRIDVAHHSEGGRQLRRGVGGGAGRAAGCDVLAHAARSAQQQRLVAAGRRGVGAAEDERHGAHVGGGCAVQKPGGEGDDALVRPARVERASERHTHRLLLLLLGALRVLRPTRGRPGRRRVRRKPSGAVAPFGGGGGARGGGHRGDRDAAKGGERRRGAKEGQKRGARVRLLMLHRTAGCVVTAAGGIAAAGAAGAVAGAAIQKRAGGPARGGGRGRAQRCTQGAEPIAAARGRRGGKNRAGWGWGRWERRGRGRGDRRSRTPAPRVARDQTNRAEGHGQRVRPAVRGASLDCCA